MTISTTLECIQDQGYWLGRFTAMASPCEVLTDVEDRALARRMLQDAHAEATRIELKFSRYRADNIIHRINHSRGAPVEVDDETANLLDYAAECYRLSAGRFDATSGILRRVWRFDGSDRIPDARDVEPLLPAIGWSKVTWARPRLVVPDGMEIDLGGIGKEYAVDRTAGILSQYGRQGILVNYGGDLLALGPRADGRPWMVGVDNPAATDGRPRDGIVLSKGALATSGDARRFLLKDGIRYGHILDPQTGWPVPGAPRAATVMAPTCVEAGTLATLAMLHGRDAAAFLRAQGVPFWCA